MATESTRGLAPTAAVSKDETGPFSRYVGPNLCPRLVRPPLGLVVGFSASGGPGGVPRGRKTHFQPSERDSGAIWAIRIFDHFGSLLTPYYPLVPPDLPYLGPKLASILRFLAKMPEKSRFCWMQTTSTRWESSNFGCFIEFGRVTAAVGHFQGILAQIWLSRGGNRAKSGSISPKSRCAEAILPSRSP